MKRIIIVLIIIGLYDFGFSQTVSPTSSSKDTVKIKIQKTNQLIQQKGYDWTAGITSKSYLSKKEMAKLC